MTRVKRGSIARKKREKILKISSGFRGSSSTLFRTANQRALKALKFSYLDRHNKKRDFRSLWITRINARVKKSATTYNNYNTFMHALKRYPLALNRKVLSTLAIKDSQAFQQIVFHVTHSKN